MYLMIYRSIYQRQINSNYILEYNKARNLFIFIKYITVNNIIMFIHVFIF